MVRNEFLCGTEAFIPQVVYIHLVGSAKVHGVDILNPEGTQLVQG